MKPVMFTFVFLLTLALTFKVTANPTVNSNETCTAESKENCHQSNGKSHGANHGNAMSSEHEKEEKLSKEMNSLFPQKQKDPSASQRPAIVQLMTPKFLEVISSSSAKLNWKVESGATNYHVQVATDPNFKWLVADDHWVKGNTYEVTKLEASKRYYWRVAAVNDGNISMYTKSLFVNSAFDTK